MKVAVINFSGNVGKTTIARHLLAPRIAGAEVISSIGTNAPFEGVAPGLAFDGPPAFGGAETGAGRRPRAEGRRDLGPHPFFVPRS
jgi:hypothetical protein